MNAVTRLSLSAFFMSMAFNSFAQPSQVLLRGSIVTMEEENAVISNGSLLVENGLIVDIKAGNAAGQYPEATIVDAQGLIFPGLINIHDHNQFSPLLPLEINGLYDNRYQWQPDGNGVDLTPILGFNPPLAFNQGSSPFNRDGFYPRHLINDQTLGGRWIEAAKWGEIQALAGGATTTEGSIPGPGITDILLRNAEHLNFGEDRICRSTDNVASAAFESFAAGVVAAAENGEIDACLLHLSEGVDAVSLGELDVLEELGMLQEWTVVVHGTPYGPDELERLADAGADLVWSPTSNLRLYGQDARADLALQMGINVSLGTDWRLSGDHNLLQALKVAWQLNQERHRVRKSFSPEYVKFSEHELVEMVTTSPAASLGWEERTGMLREGLAADILVIALPGGHFDDPYKALIDASEADVRLVMVGGDALYGDLDVMTQLKSGDFEVISGPGFEKAIDTTKSGVNKGWQTFADIESSLANTMNFDFQNMFGTYPIVGIIQGILGRPIFIQEFAFLFGLVFFDYLPAGTPFPPPPAALGYFFVPGFLAAELNTVYPAP